MLPGGQPIVNVDNITGVIHGKAFISPSQAFAALDNLGSNSQFGGDTAKGVRSRSS